MNLFSLLIVTVNWNSGGQLADCLLSLSQAHKHGPLNVVVVDNDSRDDSEACIENFTKDNLDVSLVRSGTNLGFGKACNLGVEHHLASGLRPDFILFLNPDTVVDPETFSNLFAQPAVRDPQVGIIGIQLEDNHGISFSCSNFPTALNFWVKLCGLSSLLKSFPKAQHHMIHFDHLQSREVDQVMGAFLMIRTDLFRDLRGFDPQFFVYFEEVDLCLRARQSGFVTWFEARAKAWHRGGGTTEAVKGFRQYLSVSARLRYFRKNRTFVEYLSILILSFLVEPPARFIRLALRGRFSECRDLLGGYRLFISRGIR